MKLSAEQIQANWEKFLANIKENISGNRGEQLLNFYKRYEERVILMPAAHKKSVILWYKENENHLPTNVIDKDRMIDMVYKQWMAYRTKPTTVESRLDALEYKVDQILKKIS